LSFFIFEPFIQFSGENIEGSLPQLALTAGFSQRDWVFMEEIQFKADNERFSWKIDYGERNSEIGYGAIYEWLTKSDFEFPQLEKDLNTIIRSDKTEIRFTGSTNQRNDTLTQEQIQDIKDILELYQMMMDDADLFNY